MNKGVKIAIGATMTVGIGVLVYFMFVKKDSPLYVLKPKAPKGGGNNNQSNQNTNTGSQATPSPTPTPTPSTPAPTTCPYPSTPFKNRTEGNAFREWVNDNHASYARSINLDRTGDYNNCTYIRKAFAHKVNGRSLGNAYLATLNGTPSTIGTDRDDFDYFVQRLKDRKIGYRITNDNCAVIKMHSTQSDMKKFRYQFAFCNTGTWALAMWDNNYVGTGKVIARGHYNLQDPKAGTRMTITSGSDKMGNSMKGWSKTANNDNVWTMQEVIQRYWSPWMTDSKAKTLKVIW